MLAIILIEGEAGQRATNGGLPGPEGQLTDHPADAPVSMGVQEESGKPDSHLFGGAVPPAGPGTNRGVVISESRAADCIAPIRCANMPPIPGIPHGG